MKIKRLHLLILTLLVTLLAAAACDAWGQMLRGRMSPADREKLNANRVGVVTGPAGLTYIQLGADLAKLLDDNEGLQIRVLVTVSRGSLQNIDDLLNLDKVDIAIIQGDVLDFLERQDSESFRDIKKRIGYICRLYDEELHILARDPIRSIQDLRGKLVNVAERNSGTYLTATNVLGVLGIDVQYSFDSHEKALARLISDGSDKLDAMMVVAGKPARVFQSISPDDVNRLKLHFLTVPLDPQFAAYERGKLTNAAYGQLVPAAEEVDTLTVPAVMAVYLFDSKNSRFLPLKKFTQLFFEKFNTLKGEGFHPKWKEVDLNRELPSWTRFAPAQQLLSTSQFGAVGGETRSCEQDFLAFLRSAGRDPEKISYLEAQNLRETWQKNQARSACR